MGTAPANLIAYSIWGNDPKYVTGLRRNVEQIAALLPDWHPVIYADRPRSYAALGPGVTIKAAPCHNGMFWRFHAYDDLAPGGRLLIRDADSRFTPRDLSAIALWLASRQPWLVIRDHPRHLHPMLGGMWGCAAGALGSGVRMSALIAAYPASATKGSRDAIYATDQGFLAQHIWPIAQRAGCLQLDSCTRHLYPHATPFLFGLDEQRFVGEIYDAADTPAAGDADVRLNYAAMPAPTL